MTSFKIHTISNDFGNYDWNTGNSSISNSTSIGNHQFFVYGQDNLQTYPLTDSIYNDTTDTQAHVIQVNSNSGLAMFDSDEEAADYIDKQMLLLCDDDDSNDEDAIKNINKCLAGLVCIKEVNGKKYIAYDTDRIMSIAIKSDKNGLLFQLLSQLYNQINLNTVNGVPVPDSIIELGLGGSLENTKLEIEKDGAGVRLKITSNNNYFPLNEIKNKPIAYAATKESAMNYFKNGEEYDWDAIEEWFKANDDFNDNYHETSIEYDVLANEMNDMFDSDIETLLDHASYENGVIFSNYVVSDKLKLLSDTYLMQMEIKKAIREDVGFSEKNYAKAVLIKTMADRMNVIAGAGGILISEIHYDESKKAYIGTVYDCPTKDMASRNPYRDRNDQNIIVYESGSTDRVEQNLDDVVGETINRIAPNIDLGRESFSFVFDQSVSYVCGEAGLGGSLAEALKTKIDELEESYKAYIQGEGAKTTLNIGNALECMSVSGLAVNISDDFNNVSYIYSPEYDDRILVFSVAAYNKSNETNYTIADMKKEYINYTDEFKKYQEWYTDHGAEEYQTIREGMRDEIGGSKLDSMSVEEIEEYLAKKNK